MTTEPLYLSSTVVLTFGTDDDGDLNVRLHTSDDDMHDLGYAHAGWTGSPTTHPGDGAIEVTEMDDHDRFLSETAALLADLELADQVWTSPDGYHRYVRVDQTCLTATSMGGEDHVICANRTDAEHLFTQWVEQTKANIAEHEANVAAEQAKAYRRLVW